MRKFRDVLLTARGINSESEASIMDDGHQRFSATSIVMPIDRDTALSFNQPRGHL